jgi:hypothetical protein
MDDPVGDLALGFMARMSSSGGVVAPNSPYCCHAHLFHSDHYP